MKMLYTANGRYIRCCTEEGTRPVIIRLRKRVRGRCARVYALVHPQLRILREVGNQQLLREMASSSNVTIHRRLAGTVCSAC